MSRLTMQRSAAVLGIATGLFADSLINIPCGVVILCSMAAMGAILAWAGSR